MAQQPDPSASDIRGRVALVAVGALMLGWSGCGRPPMFHITARDDNPKGTVPFKIFLKGREMGTVSGSGTFEFDAEGQQGNDFEEMQPRELEAKIPWVCGWVKTNADLHIAAPDEIVRAKAEHRAIRADMSLSYSPPGNFQWVTIFVDNRGGGPQTISIGELQQTVAAGETKDLLMSYSDDCDKARDVHLNGEVVVPVNPQKALLIDITHSHCYRETWSGYGFDEGGQGKTIYLPRPFQYLQTKPDYFMEPLPSEVTSYALGDTRSVLKAVACPGLSR